MRVLAIAKPVAFLESDGHILGEAFSIPPQVVGDGGIIDGNMLESLLRQSFALG